MERRNSIIMMKPPIKKPITATSDGRFRLAKPEMACPDVPPLNFGRQIAKAGIHLT